MTRALGLVPTPQGVAPWGTFGFDAADDGPDAAGIPDALVRRGGDQNPLQSCVWWAIAGALWSTLGVLGMRQRWISILAGYGATRAKALGGQWDQIVDIGCSPTIAADILRELGWCDDARWPYDVRNVDKRAPWDVWTTAKQEDWLRLVRLPEWGLQAAKAIRRALADHRPVLRGGPVDDAYLSMGPGAPPWRLTGRVIGRHMELCSQYDTAGLVHVSSWGDSDRIEAWDQVEDSIETDTWIVEVDPVALRRMLP